MRLFTGLDLPPEITANLETLGRRLRPAAAITWSPPANLHVTTKFIGEWPEARLADLIASLGQLPSRSAILVKIQRLGFFPNARTPHTFWCGIDAPGLLELAADTDSATAGLGIPREKRAFSPHLTLARIKAQVPLQALWDAVAKLPSLELGSFSADRFFLYRSKPGPSGSVYTKIAEFPLTKS